MRGAPYHGDRARPRFVARPTAPPPPARGGRYGGGIVIVVGGRLRREERRPSGTSLIFLLTECDSAQRIGLIIAHKLERCNRSNCKCDGRFR